ncbi:23S rRNA (pseudouridine(1915)-N(3))-methyltransferase RlmH [Candidatus Saccharibacteria bacterium]|nr:23S rRNA (pseudouridine(1915)-N(3))-methyltransferase RlmH [Candidatus Saccharibacteria bacterium]
MRIIAIGQKHDPWLTSAIERYQKRLRTPWDVKWELLPHSQFDGVKARQEESGRILSRLGPQDQVILLDEKGRQFDSPSLSTSLEESFLHAKSIVFVIGGAYGVDETIHQRANLVWSLSKLVFPHQLVRLILIEQLYRAEQISRNTGYHHI